MSNTRNRFEHLVGDLIQIVTAWAEPAGWATKRYPKRMRDNGSIFEIPALYLQKGPTRLLLDPISYDVPGAEAVVDLYLMPTYDDLASLYFDEGRWTIRHAEGDNPAIPFDESHLIQLLESFAAHATPSV